MRVSVILSFAALTIAFPGANPLDNPFALDPRSVGGKCDHNVRHFPSSLTSLPPAFLTIFRALKAHARNHARVASPPLAIVLMVHYPLFKLPKIIVAKQTR
jgi:hypothetical protein